jgi:hypothetical protein
LIIPLYLLLLGEQIEAVIYQPPGYRIILRLFRRKHSAAKVVLLTNYHLLIIGEEFASGTGRYGWIAKFCPRQNRRSITLEPGKIEVQLAIALENAGVTESILLLLDKGLQPQLQELISSLPNVTG